MSTNNQLHQVKKATANTKQQCSPSQAHMTRQIHPSAIIQRAKAAPESLSAADVLQLQRTIGNQAVGRLLTEIGRIPPTGQQAPVQRQPDPEEEEELLQGKMTETIQKQPEPEEEEELLQGKFTSDCIQFQVPEEEELMQGMFASGLTGTLQAKEVAPPNRTGMPDNLKSGIENISGMDLSGVRVQYNSSKPKQLNALAYTRGQEIHVGPGQERHLPHEGWHVVQQMQGRVKPTMQIKGKVNVNDDAGLEKEADVMGTKALHVHYQPQEEGIIQKKTINGDTIQRAVGFEFQTGWQTYMEVPVANAAPAQIPFPKETALYGGRAGGLGWTMETDGRDIEFVIEPALDETPAGVTRLTAVMTHLRYFTDILQSYSNLPRLTPDTHPLAFNAGMHPTTVIEPNGIIRAQPQSTVGVKLERIQDLFDTIDNSAQNQGDFGRDVSANYPGPQAANVSGLINAAGNIHGGPPSPKLKGLLTLVVQYLVQGVQGGSRSYAKDMAYVMSRTDFASMFDKLDIADKLQFRLNPLSFANYALATAGLAGQGLGFLINQLVTDGGDTNPGVQLPVTRAEWLNSISSPGHSIDLFTQVATIGNAAYTDAHGGNRLRALGLLGNRFDNVGPAAINEGVIVELRQMKRNIPATEWRDLTLAVMTYVRLLNAVAPGGAVPAYAEH